MLQAGSKLAETRTVIDRACRLRSMNECEAGNSPPDTGGVAAPSRKRREATAAAQTGWSGSTKRFRMRSLEEVPFSTTPSAPLKEASRLLLDVGSTPPMPGGEWPAQFIQAKPLAADYADDADGGPVCS